MNFAFTSEQLMLASSVQQCFERLPQHENGVAAPDGADVGAALGVMAAEFGELGVFGILAPEEVGGLGMGFAEAVLIAREAGTARLPFPMIEQIVAAFYLARIDAEGAAAVIEGQALASAAGGGDLVVTAEGDGLRLRGTVLAAYARHARWLAVGGRRPDGAAFGTVIDLAAAPAAIAPAADFDLTQPLDAVTLDHAVTVTLPSDQQSVLALLAAAEMLGVAEDVEQRTLQQLRDRVQFGKPIGTFQALRHAAADLHVQVENVRVAVEYAAAAFDQFRIDRQAGKPADHAVLDRAVAIAKATASRAARIVARTATQLHGGMGFSWELGLHVPVRRLVRLSTMFGSAYDHNHKLVDLLPAPDPARAFARAAG